MAGHGGVSCGLLRRRHPWEGREESGRGGAFGGGGEELSFFSVRVLGSASWQKAFLGEKWRSDGEEDLKILLNELSGARRWCRTPRTERTR